MTQQQTGRTYNTLVHENAQKQITQILDQLDEVRLALFDLKQHELHAKHREYEAATTQAETHLLNLITAVENIGYTENRLTKWI